MDHSMRISVHPGLLFKRVGPDKAFQTLAECGIEGVQFGFGGLFIPPTVVRAHQPSPFDQDIDQIYEMLRPYKEASDKYGVAVTQVHAPFPMWAMDDDALTERMADIMRKSIAATAFMGTDHCIIHPAACPRNEMLLHPAEQEKINLDLYTALIPDMKKYHVMALLENLFSRATEGQCFAAVCSDFHEAADWIDRLNAIAGEELFGFCLDTGHCTLARQNIYRAISLMGSRIKALHIHDNSGHLDEHTLPFTGVTDWEGFFRGMKETGYKGDLNFETQEFLNKTPAEINTDALKMNAAVGRYFRARLTE